MLESPRSSTPPRWISVALGSAIGLMLLAGGALLWLSRSAPGEFQSYGQVPAFTLTTQDGQPFASASLKGKFAAIGFIYTSCPDICPVVTTNMVQLQHDLKQAGLLGSEVLLLSVSVDPEVDRPAVLKQYATDRGADLGSWTFLTGELAAIKTLVSDGFKFAFDKAASAHAGHGLSYEVIHSGKVVLVDPQGEIRAYYDGEVLDAAKVITDIQKLRQ